MKTPTRRFVAAASMLMVGAIVTAAATPDSPLAFHERKEVAGLAVVFGAEPEPALTHEMQNLVWRVTALAGGEAYTTMTSASVTVTFNGESYGPIDVRPIRSTPGSYQARRIFTAVGEYTSVLTFKKGDETESHSVDFNFNIADRSELEIPRRRGGN